MVEYFRNEIISKNGNVRNYYSKLYKNGTKKKITKEQYYKKVGGGGNNHSYPVYKRENILANALYKKIDELKENNKSENILKIWLNNNNNKLIINELLKDFNIEGKLFSGQPSATTFNDFYKWSMLPVIRYIETCPKFKDKPIHVTFGVNIRTDDLRNKLVTDENLQNRVYNALVQLKERTFNKDLFKKIIVLKGLNIDNNTIDLICGSDENPRSLIDEIKRGEGKYIPNKDYENKVVVSFFKANDSKLKSERIYIEATGPWHKVTWLETTLMQCVYEELLRDKLENDGTSYVDWLFGALKRCSRSVFSIKSLENIVSENPLKGALFTGRRTGGLAFLLLQNLFVKDNYPNCIGTSSVDSWYKISSLETERALTPIGTHAHELSMVLSTLLPDIDTTYPLTQLVGHYLYYLKSLPGGFIENKSIMPMLPDTLGTESFVRVASLINVPIKHKLNYNSTKNNRINGTQIRFLDIIGSARQDSGRLEDFVKIMDKYKFQGSIMASEIDDFGTLVEVSMIKRSNGDYAYKTFGAGGFFGDSEAAWNKSIKNISMAVKAVRVFVDFKETKVKPIKLGDSNDLGKLEVNGLLNNVNSKNAKNKALAIKTYSKRPNINNVLNLHDIQTIFDNALINLDTIEKNNENNKNNKKNLKYVLNENG